MENDTYFVAIFGYYSAICLAIASAFMVLAFVIRAIGSCERQQRLQYLGMALFAAAAAFIFYFYAWLIDTICFA